MKAIEIRDHVPEGRRHDRKLFKRIASAIVFTLALATACGVGWYAGAKLAYEQKVEEITKVHYVEEGETLWDIAGSVASEQDDIRRIIWEIQKDNGIGGNDKLQPGQRLIIKF